MNTKKNIKNLSFAFSFIFLFTSVMGQKIRLDSLYTHQLVMGTNLTPIDKEFLLYFSFPWNIGYKIHKQKFSIRTGIDFMVWGRYRSSQNYYYYIDIAPYLGLEKRIWGRKQHLCFTINSSLFPFFQYDETTYMNFHHRQMGIGLEALIGLEYHFNTHYFIATDIGGSFGWIHRNNNYYHSPFFPYKSDVAEPISLKFLGIKLGYSF